MRPRPLAQRHACGRGAVLRGVARRRAPAGQ